MPPLKVADGELRRVNIKASPDSATVNAAPEAMATPMPAPPVRLKSRPLLVLQPPPEVEKDKTQPFSFASGACPTAATTPGRGRR